MLYNETNRYYYKIIQSIQKNTQQFETCYYGMASGKSKKVVPMGARMSGLCS
jgi:hypothetical protein